MTPIYLFRNSDSKPLGAVRVDRYPDFPMPQRTIALHTHNFVGKVLIEASIALDPQDADWFTVMDEDFAVRGAGEPAIRNRSSSLSGNFIWMRATITAGAGHVDRVLVI